MHLFILPENKKEEKKKNARMTSLTTRKAKNSVLNTEVQSSAISEIPEEDLQLAGWIARV